MEKQLKQFFKFLENDKKASNNTLQSYKRDLSQYINYLAVKEIKYNKVSEEQIKEYKYYNFTPYRISMTLYGVCKHCRKPKREQ